MLESFDSEEEYPTQKKEKKHATKSLSLVATFGIIVVLVVLFAFQFNYFFMATNESN